MKIRRKSALATIMALLFSGSALAVDYTVTVEPPV